MAVIAGGSTLSPITTQLGSWTPSAIGSINNNFSLAIGRYYKVGKLVYCVARYHTPHGSDNSQNNSGGFGDGGSGIIKLGGLPFTSANTGQKVMIGSGGHFARISVRTVIAVIEPNTTEIRFFGEGTELDGSYGTSTGQGSPSAGNEMTVGNAHINFNDGSQKLGLANFVYYTDTA